MISVAGIIDWFPQRVCKREALSLPSKVGRRVCPSKGPITVPCEFILACVSTIATLK